jgi:hypothetical protein
MFKSFWDEKNYIIQTVGILTAIGAIFLTIPLPSNQPAKELLLNIQFVWLVIISISVGVLALNFWIFFYKYEEKIKERFTIQYDNSFSFAFTAIACWLIYNLWKYILILYKDSLLQAMKIVDFFIFGTILLLIPILENKFNGYKKHNKSSEFLFSFFLILVISSLFTFLNLFSLSRLNLKSWITESGFIFLLIESVLLGKAAFSKVIQKINQQKII